MPLSVRSTGCLSGEALGGGSRAEPESEAEHGEKLGRQSNGVGDGSWTLESAVLTLIFARVSEQLPECKEGGSENEEKAWRLFVEGRTPVVSTEEKKCKSCFRICRETGFERLEYISQPLSSLVVKELHRVWLSVV